MSDSAPLSFAQRASNLASNQAMPLQRSKPAQSAAPKKAAAAAAPATSITSPTAASAATATNGQPLKSPTKPTSSSTPPNQSAAVTPSPATSSPATTSSSTSAIATGGAGPVKVVKAPKEGFALVTAVSSGDTLIVIGSRVAAGQKTPEKIIIVSGIQAPKFAKGKNQKDEPFAWESREYLRKRVIGKQSQTEQQSTHSMEHAPDRGILYVSIAHRLPLFVVFLPPCAVKFSIGYTHEDSGREYATVWVDGDNLAVDILQHGWAKVKTGTNKDGKERMSVRICNTHNLHCSDCRALSCHIKSADPFLLDDVSCCVVVLRSWSPLSVRLRTPVAACG